ncbi:hypothetical protein [Streptomyces sp. NPDC054866]
MEIALESAGGSEALHHEHHRGQHPFLAPPHNDEGTPVMFARWYTGWLQKAELAAL